MSPARAASWCSKTRSLRQPEGPEPDPSVVSPRPFRGPRNTNPPAPIRPISGSPRAPPPGSPSGPAGRLRRYGSPWAPADGWRRAVHAPVAQKPAPWGSQRQDRIGPEIRALTELARAGLATRDPTPSAASSTPGSADADARRLWGPAPRTASELPPRKWPIRLPADRFLPSPQVGNGPLQRGPDNWRYPVISQVIADSDRNRGRKA